MSVITSATDSTQAADATSPHPIPALSIPFQVSKAPEDEDPPPSNANSDPNSSGNLNSDQNSEQPAPASDSPPSWPAQHSSTLVPLVSGTPAAGSIDPNPLLSQEPQSLHTSAFSGGTNAQSTINRVAVITVGDQVFRAEQPQFLSDAVEIGSQTPGIGGPPVIVNGQTVSMAPAGIVIGTHTQPLSFTTHAADSADPADITAEPVAAATVSIGNEQYSAFTIPGSDSAIIITGKTLSPGGDPVILNHQTVSALPDGGLRIGASSVPLSFDPAPTLTDAATLNTTASLSVIASQPGTGDVGALGSVVVFGSDTLSVGGPATVIDGQSVSAVDGGLEIGSTTLILPSAHVDLTESLAAVQIGGKTYMAVETSSGSDDMALIGSVTLTVGGSATVISGETFTAASSGVKVDGTMHSFSALATNAIGASTGGMNPYSTGPGSAGTTSLSTISAASGILHWTLIKSLFVIGTAILAMFA